MIISSVEFFKDEQIAKPCSNAVSKLFLNAPVSDLFFE